MLSTHWIHAMLVTLAPLAEVCAIAQNPVYDFVAKQQKAEVSVLAISSSIHPGWSASQEVYLANIRFKGNSPQLAKLVDIYMRDGLSIRQSILAERHLLHMTLTRNPQCDSTSQNFFLGSGDTNIFDANARTALKDHSTEKIPCFNVAHEATRLAN